MASRRITIQAKGKATGLSDVLIYIYDEDGNVEVNGTAMTEDANQSGYYYYDFSTSTTGWYTYVVQCASRSFERFGEVYVGTPAAVVTTTSGVTFAELRADLGEVYDTLVNGTTALSHLLSRAEQKIRDVTGTTTGYEMPIRDYCNYLACRQALGGAHGAELGAGNVRIGKKEIREKMVQHFKEAKDDLYRKGYKLDSRGVVRFGAVNV